MACRKYRVNLAGLILLAHLGLLWELSSLLESFFVYAAQLGLQLSLLVPFFGQTMFLVAHTAIRT